MTGRHPNDDRLLLAMDLQLSGRRQGRLTAHVASCAHCQTRAAQLKATLADAERAYRRVEAAHADPDLGRARLEGALQEAADAWDRSWWTRVRSDGIETTTISRAVTASAAVVAVIWLAGMSISPRRVVSERGQGHALPVAALTPGAVSTLTAAELCAGTRSSRTVSDDVRRRVLARYGMQDVPADRYELDALVTLDLGGTVAPENLWPQPYASSLWNAHVKDALERLLADEVCHGRIALSQAQRELATDWVAAYKQRFHTETPLPGHAQSTEIDDDLEVESPASVRTVARFDTTPIGARP